MDPIAELLSQLSGVRRAAGSSSSQLLQLQMELQLQRQQAQAHRQTLDRLARRAPGPASNTPAAAATHPSAISQPAATAAAAAQPPAAGAQAAAAAVVQSSQPKQRKPETGFLLSNLESEESGEEDGSRESAKQRIFIQELLLSALNLEDTQSESDS